MRSDRRFLARVAVALLVAGTALASGAQTTGADPSRFNDSIVRVEAEIVPDGQTVRSLGARRTGSGVILDARTVLTIGYLVLEAEQVTVVTADGRRAPGNVAGYDHATGFGLVRTLVPLAGHALELGDSDQVTERQKLLTLGHGEPEATEILVLSRKPFSGSWEYLLDRPIFTFPPVNNWSGAALIDADGKLVGIGSLIVNDAASGRPGVPGNLFVPVNLLKPILGELLAQGRRSGPSQPWLGLATEQVRGHLMVSRVTHDSPAEAAGLEAGDIIVAVDGERIGDQADFYRRVWKLGPAGVTVSLRVLKGADVREVLVRSIDRTELMRKPRGI
ncbi:MAG: serine protease [Burkholderiales bacterium]|nr:MAG: serine protease [Burkholderiales bacterium]